LSVEEERGVDYTFLDVRAKLEMRGTETAELNSFELDHTIRTEFMVKKRFSTFNSISRLNCDLLFPKSLTFSRELWQPSGEVW